MAVIAEGTLRWNGGLTFEGGAPGGPVSLVDGDAREAPSPVTTLLVAAASCAAVDVVLILGKMRIVITALDVAIRGERRETQPRRLETLHLVFTVSGDGLDQAKLGRAVSLSVEKYCSVLSSLASDIAITYEARVA